MSREGFISLMKRLFRTHPASGLPTSIGPGSSPPSYDKQFVRDWLETQDWNKKAPAPSLPADVLANTTEKYEEALRHLLL